MFRIDTPNKAVDLFGAGKHGFRDGDKALGINPTELSAAQMNAYQEELAGIIEAAGLVLNKANNAQLLEALKRLIDAQSGNYALDTGAANAYVVALDPTIAAYTDGMTVRVKAVNANTGASTLNAGGGVKSLVNDAGGALAAGDIPAGSVFTATYILSADKFYITSIVKSQTDALYMALLGNQSVAGIKDFTGQLKGKGTPGADAAPSGYIGEAIDSSAASYSAVMGNGVALNCHSYTPPAGDWEVSGGVAWGGNGTPITYLACDISTISTNISAVESTRLAYPTPNSIGFDAGTYGPMVFPIRPRTIRCDGATPIYVTAIIYYGSSPTINITSKGFLHLRRAR